MALVPAGSVSGASVTDRDGAALGTITELMLDGDSGAVAYAVLAYGGVAGIGEKLFAVPWPRLSCGADGVTADLSAAQLDAAEGFDKDAWPTEADATLA